MYCALEHSFDSRDDKNVLKLPRVLCPIQAAVFPLVNKEDLPDIADQFYNDLRHKNIIAFYDQSGSIGKRYARMDEIGTPYCVTVDFDVKKDSTVTIRDRDTGEQIRLKPDELAKYIKEKIQN